MFCREGPLVRVKRRALDDNAPVVPSHVHHGPPPTQKTKRPWQLLQQIKRLRWMVILPKTDLPSPSSCQLRWPTSLYRLFGPLSALLCISPLPEPCGSTKLYTVLQAQSPYSMWLR